jgi:SAM-dependent methyltransferase
MDAAERVRPLLVPSVRDRAAVVDGHLDVLDTAALGSTGRAQDLMLTRVVPSIYERWWRPALGRVAKGVFGPGMSDEKRIARLLMGLGSGDGVLDVACGTGNFTRDFARSVGPDGLVVGIDVSETMLARAAADTDATQLPQVAYVRGDAEDLPFRDDSFDAVCCFAALHLFADPFAALDSFTRVLTPGGRLAIFTSVRGRSVPLRGVERAIQAQSGMRMFERDEITSALAERGFGDVQQQMSGMTQFVGGRLTL